MNPFERVHELIISGKVIGPDGSWVSRTEALKEKRAVLQHVLSGEVYVNGAWTPLSEVNTSAPPVAPPPGRHEYEKETAVMPPPRFDREALHSARRTATVQPPAATPPSLPEAPPIELLPPVAAPESVSAADLLHSDDQPHLRLPDERADDLSLPLQHKAIADSFLSRTPLPQTDYVAPHAVSNNVREPLVVPTLEDEPVMHPPAPPPVLSKKSDSVPVKNVSPLAKLDKLDDAKKTEMGGHSDNDVVTIRKTPLGKGASLTISESAAAGTLAAVCSVEGFIDQSNSDTFHLQLMSMLESGVRFFVIDFERTVLVGSAGWGTLAVAARMVKMSGGRLLICSMKPEIAESFHLLQFNDVIDARPALPDCIATIREIIDSQPAPANGGNGAEERSDESFAELPLHEKIRAVISRHGPLSLFQIAAHLKGAQYGNVKIGPIKLYFVLKDLNLESHWKRVRYYRSC